VDDALDYAFPHSAADEARRLDLFQQRLDPLTIRRMERIGIGRGARCLELGGGRGSITRWLAERVVHVPTDVELLRRMVSWLRPGGRLLLEEPDFGMWVGDADPVWMTHPASWQKAFPGGSLSRCRWLLAGFRSSGSPASARMPRSTSSSMKAIGPAAVAAGALTVEQATALVARPSEPDFLSCGFVHIGVWGRRP